MFIWVIKLACKDTYKQKRLLQRSHTTFVAYVCKGPRGEREGKALSGADFSLRSSQSLANIRLLRRESLTSTPNPSLRKEGLSARAPAASAEDDVYRVKLREVREVREIKELSLNSLNSLNSLSSPPLPMPHDGKISQRR